jgi:hypothetical protein
VANETGAFFFLINGPEIMSKLAGALACPASHAAARAPQGRALQAPRAPA